MVLWMEGDNPVVVLAAGGGVVAHFSAGYAAREGADKAEGIAIDAAGTAIAVTDNDGADDPSGETVFRSIGAIRRPPIRPACGQGGALRGASPCDPIPA